ncbi:MAG: ComEC/Rec2 family competence protein [Chloroflexi bacterium]|nr:ComEC/Rec2 family competence protein [Chloroflexota bacterium]
MTAWLGAAILLGIGLAAWWGPAPAWAVIGLAVIGAAAALTGRRLLLVGAVLAALALGLARGGHHVASQTPLLQAPAGAALTVIGTVVDDVPGPRRTLQVVGVAGAQDQGSRPAAGRVQVFAPRALALPNARVAVSGVFVPASPRATNSLAGNADTWAGTLGDATVRVIEAGTAADPPALLRLRRHVDASIRSALPEPHASLLSAMLVGIRQRLPDELRDDFLTSGLIHIVAISGFNITLIALWVRRLAGWGLGRYGVGLAAVLLPLYAVLAGAEPGVIRAAIMGDLVLVAWILGRDADALTALALAGAGMALVQPQALGDVGFQLSFAGTLGLIVIAPRVSAVLTERIRFPRWSAELIATTTAASLMVTPIIAHTFERFQLMAVPANLLALAAPAAIMATGAPVAIWASAGWPAADVVGWAAWLPLEYLIQAGRLAAQLPGASLATSGFDLPQALVSYLCIGAALVLLGRPPPRLVRSRVGSIVLPRRAVYGVALVALIAPPAMAVAGMPRVFDDGATVATVDLSGRAPTVYVRKGDDRVVVAGSRLDRLLLDRALPRWDLQVDNLAVASSGGNLSHMALDLVGARDVAVVQAPPTHALGAHLVAPNRAGRAPVVVDASRTTGALETQLVPAEGRAWVLVRSSDAVFAVAPPTVSQPALPADLRADVLVLGRSTTLGAMPASALRDSGVAVVIAPHPRLPEIVARAVNEDGQIVVPEPTLDTPRLVGSAWLRADRGTIEVRR